MKINSFEENYKVQNQPKNLVPNKPKVGNYFRKVHFLGKVVLSENTYLHGINEFTFE